MPVTLTAMAELKVVVRMVVAQVVPAFPGAKLSEVGLRVSEKLGAGSTLMAIRAVLVTPPPVAVRVVAYVPPAMVALTVAVSTLDPAPGAAMVAGENLAVTPWGKPEIVRVTAALKEALRVVVTVIVPLAPAATSSVLGANDRESGGSGLVTVRLSGALREVLPAVPLIVSVYVPAVAPDVAARVRVVLPEPVREVGAKLPVTPAGNPVTEKLTAELNPLFVFTVKVAVVLAPGTTEAEVAAPAIWKLGRVFPSSQWFTNWVASTEPSPVAMS